MAIFINLTPVNGDDLFLNMDGVSRFYRNDSSTFILLEDGKTTFSVKETPEQILSKIKELQIEDK